MKVVKKILVSLMVITAVLISACNNSSQNSVEQNATTVVQNNEANDVSTIQNETSDEIETTSSQVVEQTTGEKTVEATTKVEQNETSDETETTISQVVEQTVEANNILVAYFSATGTTKRVAEKIAELTGADLYEIVPSNPYSDADLNWNDNNSRSTKEMDDKNVRPEIGSSDIDLTNYTTIYLGYPIWWGDAQRIMSTFVEKYNFDGKTIIPFCTSGGSGIGRSGSNLAELSGGGNWLNGERLNGSADTNSIQNFIDANK